MLAAVAVLASLYRPPSTIKFMYLTDYERDDKPEHANDEHVLRIDGD